METSAAQHLLADVNAKQPDLIQHFVQVVQAGDLSHAYLFSGSAGDGKLAVAKVTTMALFCLHPTKEGFPCGACNECLRIANDEHPDVLVIEPDGQSIKIEQVRALKREFSKSAVEGNQKVFIIDAADTMTVGAANSLLKVIEEPLATVTAFLLTTNYHHILPTIRSRTQLVEFPQIKQEALQRYLAEHNLSKTEIKLALQITKSTTELDQLIADQWLSKMKQQIEGWFTWISKDDVRAFPFVQTNLMPLIGDRFSQNVTVTMMCLIFQDVFNVKFRERTPEQLAFGDIYDLLKSTANQLSDYQIVSMINDILATAQLQRVNVGFQGILEVLTLKCLQSITSK
ncbi:DNA polymerase III subunit delta' [Fructilactobacillus cliffordii]|uniref:DNA polymerase III subunit delta n=1 Tax=Fructilactobacillus cliffordii TaxID=2940299 RepID=A0A9Q8ZS92_9LACO|nr:DNA polymerase III subunit delta' [Fructilactobacillus cliffordii]USS88709.1 DNA polymerase III subunit delta' [Fructilactobacillus cliffordii]